MSHTKPLPLAWFAKDATEIAPLMLGKILVRRFDDSRTQRFVISETEAYMPDDAASHAYKGRTERNASMFERAGTIYIYFIYGVHFCLNITTGQKSNGQAVLIRALIPLDTSLDVKKYSGPGKLCKNLELTREQDGLTVSKQSGPLWIEAPTDTATTTIISEVSPRIGISKATDKLWRWRLK